MAKKLLEERTPLEAVKDTEQQATEVLGLPDSHAYWERRVAALEKAKEMERLADRVDQNEQASLADLNEAARYRKEAARLRQRADDTTDDLTDLAPAVAAVGCLPNAGRTTETPEQRRERLRQRQATLKGQGVHDYTKRAAGEEGITTARFRQIVGSTKKAATKEVVAPGRKMAKGSSVPTAHDPFGQRSKR